MKTSGTEAMFSYLNKNIRFEVRLSTEAEGGAGPMAHTLISDFDTAILLVDEIPCSTGADMTGYVLTQDRDLPILLSGCCSPAKQ
ncbi:MAG: hypothetical protein GY952_06145 [Rhodobacteraceae bacterium]|nr:hypothetical protein [Paracoccaceae bacterium]